MYKKDLSLKIQVEKAIKGYLDSLDGEPTVNLYELVIEQIEAPLVKAVMEYTQGNQSKSAKWLGLHRTTFRKMVHKYMP